MTIAFDLDAVIRNPFSGFHTFGKALLHAIDKLDNPPEMLLFFQRRYRKTAHAITKDLGAWARPVEIRFRLRWLQNLWQWNIFPDFSIFTGGYDLFHSFHHFMPLNSKCPALLTVHDLRRYALPQLYPNSKLYRFEAAVKRADHFIAVSHATKQDIIHFFNIPEDRIDVVHLACSSSIVQTTDMEKRAWRRAMLSGSNIDIDRYFITISSADSRKNIGASIEAFLRATPDLPARTGLIIAGRLPAGFTPPADKPVFCIGTVKDIMPWLTCSMGLVFPSLYEGFGLPVLEGFAASVPVITSNLSSMPEVAGNAAILVDPHNIDELANALTEAGCSQEKRNAMIRAGHERLRCFSWDRSAKQTVNIYRKIVEKT